jgi:hypothetical protein
MSWNYRLVQRDYVNEIEVQIHEVYYNKDGTISMYTQSPISPSGYGETLDDAVTSLKNDINLMRAAFNKPVLTQEDL